MGRRKRYMLSLGIGGAWVEEKDENEQGALIFLDAGNNPPTGPFSTTTEVSARGRRGP